MQPKYDIGYLVVDVFSAYGDFHMDTVGIIVGVKIRNPPLVVEDDINCSQSIIYEIHWRHDGKVEPLGEDLLNLWCMVPSLYQVYWIRNCYIVYTGVN